MRDQSEYCGRVGMVYQVLGVLVLVTACGLAISTLIPMLATNAIARGLHLPFSMASGVLICSLAVIHLAVGTGIKKHQDWSRVAGIVLGILLLFGFPIGTIIGAYALWCLTQRWN